jgi:hypothetical protein
MRESSVVRPTIFCRILHVTPSATAPECRWSVTVADDQGATVTVDLAAEEVKTYEGFQAALLRETGSPFRYLACEPQPDHRPVRQRHPHSAVVAASGTDSR